MRLKIVIIASSLRPKDGGPPLSEAGLARGLAVHHDVRVLCHEGRFDREFAARNGIADQVVSYRGLDVLKVLFGFGKLKEFFSDSELIHINGHWRWENIVFGRVARILERPYFLHPRGMMNVAHRSVWKKKVFNFLFGNSLMRGAAGVVALSQFEKKHFHGKPIDESKVFVIPNGIEMLEKEAIQNEQPRHYFLYLGRLEKRKNLLFLVRAFNQYLKNGGTKDLVLMGPVEREYDRELIKFISECGISSRVKILAPEYGENKAKWIKESLAVVYPATDEVFGRVPFEAIGLGVAPIVPDESGAAEYLRERVLRSIYRHNDAESLAKLLLEHEKAPIGTAQLVAARKLLNSQLSWDSVVHEVENMYSRVIRGAHGKREVVESHQVSKLQQGG